MLIQLVSSWKGSAEMICFDKVRSSVVQLHFAEFYFQSVTVLLASSVQSRHIWLWVLSFELCCLSGTVQCEGTESLCANIEYFIARLLQMKRKTTKNQKNIFLKSGEKKPQTKACERR